MLRRRLGLLLMYVVLGLLAGAGAGTAASLADVAPVQWGPAAADVARTVRPCPAPATVPAAVCWSMTEDASAWMAQPAGSRYGWGQCTYYVGIMRPDVWDGRAPPSIDPQNNWDAWTWAHHAQAEGLAVDGSPRAGDVMVWSRRAVSNDTGHVAIVDAVGGTDPATGDVEITISEMNLDGFDKASLGQGDTMVLEEPRSQLVRGMIQFIHRPGQGYTAPAWPSGSSTGATTGAPAPGEPATGEPATASNPSLAVGLWSNHLAGVSRSAAPIAATVSTASGTVVTTLRLTANRVTTLSLPAGAYKVCASQPAAGGWNAASGCATAIWPAAGATPARAHTAGAHGAHRHHDRRRGPHGGHRGPRAAGSLLRDADLQALVASRIGVFSY